MQGIKKEIAVPQGRRVQGCGESISFLLPYRNATKIFLPIFYFEKNFILQNTGCGKLTSFFI
jgi:hypothetical protein